MQAPLQDRYHYRVIERALAEIDRLGPQASLADLAARLGMSAAHFQRLFSAWVGVSPKRYQQYLLLGAAKARLREPLPLLAVAQDVGLSGTGRLHDLFVRWEAMSPAEYAKGGAGLSLGWALCQTPFGAAVGVASARGLCGLSFVDHTPEAALADLQSRWPKAIYLPDPDVTARVDDLFAGRGGDLHLIGGPFQIKVWEALLALPQARLTSYSALAATIGSPRAVRAVGTAVGRNPIGFFIPCHRALRLNGDLGGYHWGLMRKRAILAWEAARDDARQPEGTD